METQGACNTLQQTEKAMNLFRAIGQKATLPNGQPAPPQDVEVMLSGGGIVHGRVENVYEDGIAIRDSERVFYIPVTGLVSVIYNEPAEIYDEPPE
jgi:hypothetical protein